MVDEKWEDENVFDEITDAASLFEEIDSAPERKDIGDILFVEGIEEDESVVDEDLTEDEESAAIAQGGTKTVSAVFRKRDELLVAESRHGKRSIAVRKRKIGIHEPVPVGAGIGGMTVAEFFVPLVRHSPSSKIRTERNTIGSIFTNFIDRVQA